MEKEVGLRGFVFDAGEPSAKTLIENVNEADKINFELEIKVLGLEKSGRNSGIDR